MTNTVNAMWLTTLKLPKSLISDYAELWRQTQGKGPAGVHLFLFRPTTICFILFEYFYVNRLLQSYTMVQFQAINFHSITMGCHCIFVWKLYGSLSKTMQIKYATIITGIT